MKGVILSVVRELADQLSETEADESDVMLGLRSQPVRILSSTLYKTEVCRVRTAIK